MQRISIMMLLMILGVESYGQERFVSVNGQKFRIKEMGTGEVTVLFESGMSDSLEVWGSIPDSVSTFARVFLYDRADIGKSDSSRLERTIPNMVLELRSILQQEQIKPPYVLAGHSLGGFITRYFASQYPAEVKGLLLLDPSPEAYWNEMSKEELAKYIEGGNEWYKTKFAPRYRKEWIQFVPNMKYMKNLNIPKDLPIILVSATAWHWFKYQKKIITEFTNARQVELEGEHHIFKNHPDQTVEFIRELSHNMTLKRGTFKTKSATYQADFGTLLVPENREKPHSRLIELPITRIRAVNKDPAEPIFRLEGGPGLTNMKFKPRDYLFANHDFVAVGYRGVDGSPVLDCPEIEKAFKGDGDDVLSEESLKKTGEAWTNCASRLKQSGVDIDGYNIMEVIEDLEAARVALGYERINLLSMSYGTRVAYLYGLKHPNSIHRSVMIGANPPGHMVWEPETIDAQLQYYSGLWAKDSRMSALGPDLLATMRNVLHNMPRKWLFFNIDPGKVRIVTFTLLFHRQTAPLVFDAYVAAEHGDPSGLALMSMAHNYVLPSMMAWGEMASKAVSADFDSTRDYSVEMDPPASLSRPSSSTGLGSPLGKLLWGPLRFGAWPIKLIPEEYRQPQRSDVETLLISGSVDFSTPAELAANELLPYLSRGKQVVLAELGHVNDVWTVQPKATERLLTSFYETGVADDSLCTYIPMDFNVKWGFPKIAKVGLGVVVGGTALLVAGVVWVIRSIR